MNRLRVLVAPARRELFSGAGKLVLSTTAIGLLAGGENLALAAKDGSSMQDVDILNVALALEHEAINAYQLGAGSGLLQASVLGLAVQFQGHHKAHRDALAGTIEKLGGRPVDEKKPDEYASGPCG